MASSYQTYRGTAKLFNDGDVYLVLGLARDLAQKVKYVALRSHIVQWQESLRAFAPGLIHLNFDVLERDPDLERLFIELLADIVGVAKEHGYVVPAGVLQRHFDTRNIRFSDVNSDVIEAAVQQFVLLLSEAK